MAGRCRGRFEGARRQELVVAGYRQPESVHQLAHIINDALGNNGKTVKFHKTPANEFGSLADLASDLGKFDRR